MGCASRQLSYLVCNILDTDSENILFYNWPQGVNSCSIKKIKNIKMLTRIGQRAWEGRQALQEIEQILPEEQGGVNFNFFSDFKWIVQKIFYI